MKPSSFTLTAASIFLDVLFWQKPWAAKLPISMNFSFFSNSISWYFLNLCIVSFNLLSIYFNRKSFCKASSSLSCILPILPYKFAISFWHCAIFFGLPRLSKFWISITSLDLYFWNWGQPSDNWISVIETYVCTLTMNYL